MSEVRPRLPAAARRSQLLEVALACFAVGGYHETSMEEIAEAAGVTKPVLYQHFQSKQELFLELLEQEGVRLLKEVQVRAGAEEQPYRQVLAGFQAYFDFACQRTSAFQILFGSGARGTDELTETVRRLEAELATVIAAFIDADVDDEHRDLLGYAVVGLAEVAGRRWVATHASAGLNPADADQMATRLADLVWAGLRGLPRDDRS